MGLKASVESVMRSPPITAQFSYSVWSIADKMFTNNIGSVIVMSGGAPSGLVTESDVVKSIVDRKDPMKTTAQDIMSSPVLAIEADKTVRDALEMMRNKDIRRLAVTKNGRLVGIISERRALEALI